MGQVIAMGSSVLRANLLVLALGGGIAAATPNQRANTANSGANSIPTNQRLRMHPIVPREYQSSGESGSPNGESPIERYRRAYEAFWLNCVMVKSEDIQSRCPSLCNGTAAATAGCADGTTNAEHQISALERAFPEEKVQAYLRTVATDPKNVALFLNTGYFNGHPQAAQVK